MTTEDTRTNWQKLADRLEPCEVLPDDIKFILRRFPANRGFKKTALNGYKGMWIAAMLLEPVGHKKQNIGRRAANTWLRLNHPIKRA